ncbi:MAG: alpha/beta hydrolase [Acidimicrobiales bacterium]|nr:alpha/beta hydrolase [Acidimicrobiales bacterium]
MVTSTRERRTAVRSPDGTHIGVSLQGAGPPLVLVEPAGHHRGFSAFGGLVPLLSSAFTVVTYDRRGRGESTDTAPYQVEREVEDLAVVLDAVGGAGDVHGASSGALLAVQAVVHGVPIRRLTLFEPPIDDDTEAQTAFTSSLRARLERYGNEAALAFFLASIMPSEMVDGMRGGPEWEAMARVAGTLVYDCTISTATDTATLGKVDVPALVLDSMGSTDDLTGMAATIARHLPDAEHLSLPGGWHGVDDQALASAIRRFLSAGSATGSPPGP